MKTMKKNLSKIIPHEIKHDIFIENHLIPDVFNNLHLTQDLHVFYNKHLTHNGQELSPFETLDKPVVHFHPKKNKFYSFCMVDPDAPSRIDPKYREWVHWVVINITDDGKVEEGDEVIEYIGSKPPKRSGFHRYVFALFEHDEKIKYHEEKLTVNATDRGNWHLRDFMKKYHLSDPIGASFFISKSN